MTRRSDQFQTIRTEGALLPPDILQSIASLKADGVSPQSYHLAPGTKLSEAVAHSWSVLQKYWKGFQQARQNLDDAATGTEVTNQQWLLPLFEELKYGRLTTVKSPEIDGRIYPVERFYANQPIHLIGCNLPLDRRTTGARGAATASPHSMMQEYLNRSPQALWGMFSNGLRLRVLRDNVSLSRQAFIEFDLEAMMEGEVYADFALLWMVCHQSRIEADKPENCWLEKWSHLARELGTRILSHLRVGVTQSIEALGRGFIEHPRNDRLREKLQSGTLDAQDYYRQLLRVVYRLLFLFVAEDRSLLHPTDANPEACEIYDKYYSTRRLRELADNIRGSKHADLWHSLSLVFDRVNREQGCPELVLVGLGSFLWNPNNTADLLGPGQTPDGEDPVLITNDYLLTAVRALAYVVQNRVRRAVDYRNLGSEELGSVYESLLELHPVLNVPARTFELSVAAGHERKTTGSYYTPDSLVQCLLDSALEPVVEDRLKGKRGSDAELALLDLKVCDPASGSGHFLIAAAHRLARHLARIRTGESEPSPDDYQHALRDVISHCIYGVDINPMAVELCKVSLWVEALEPGKPLTFLDHHIQCGNSLLGATPALLKKGIPDDAFKPIEGDDNKVCAELKKDNKQERKDYELGYRDFHFVIEMGNLPAEFARLTSEDDESFATVKDKERKYADLVRGTAYQNARLLADAWCATFVWKKDDSELGRLCPTERMFRNLQSSPHTLLPGVREEIERLSQEYQFIHWHLACPDVFQSPAEGETAMNELAGWDGGFDVVLGNPPWERVNLQEREWFAERVPQIAQAPNTAARRQLISALKVAHPATYETFRAALRNAAVMIHFGRNSGRFPLCGRGDVNLYAVFAELMQVLLGVKGRAGRIVPSGIVTTNTTRFFFAALIETQSLVSFFDFDNRKGIFPAVQGNVRFCLLTTSRQENQDFEIAAQLSRPAELNSPEFRYRMTFEDVHRINPRTPTCPLLPTVNDAEIVKLLYRRNGCVADEESPSGDNRFTFRRMLHMSDDSGLFCTLEGLQEAGLRRSGNVFLMNDKLFVPLYEAKLAHQYNHRAATFEGIEPRRRFGVHPGTKPTFPQHLGEADFAILPRYWVPIEAVNQKEPCAQWLMAFRDAISAVADSRSLVASVLPVYGVGHTCSLFFVAGTGADACCAIAAFNSFAMDYVLRQKASGAHASFFIIEQLPFPKWQSFYDVRLGNEKAVDSLRSRVLELTFTAWDLMAFAADCGYDGPPFRWDEERRFLLRCELDAAYFHLYLGSPSKWGADSPRLREMFPTPLDAVDYIMETFPIVKRKDEQAHGEYRTKRVILEIYDEMAKAIETGEPYQTRLDPPPGPPTDTDGNFIPIDRWDPAHWPPHIHPPREETIR